MDSFIRKMKEKRKSLGLTQTDLGAMTWTIGVGAAQSRIKRIENGQAVLLDRDKKKIAKILSIDEKEENQGSSAGYVGELYPEIKAILDLLYLGHTQNPELVLTAWKGLKDIAEQKIKQHSTLLIQEEGKKQRQKKRGKYEHRILL